ncbi:ABC transporter, substrate-binding protein, aliphatic sulfonates family [Candidatus Nitrososphaera evergladensis SR1]|uniref:ABC transporter, substrate-binding protein, aliphatic sulfonates family n=1 Tax=Candidatus Nitrososphaera evergladensis SR1 TaxID=1459636 RepID=A0A075MPQ9_9ARCH|nr:ABC transporter substrate-binding protein [Candidatus Nitrososphaera evergladensis]AIF83110.1 ABC transporter, substrate-binding protein, aliphatic sulfonates family [Candidatus Nitrososphaera evergladensis SR1]
MDFRLKLGIAAALVAFVIGTSVALNDQPLARYSGASGPSDVLRLGYFPNVNHAQAVIGVGNGDYQKALGNIQLETQVFTSGPSAIDGFFGNRIDCSYVGPNPAVNGYLRSEGSLKVVSGVSSGGTVFVVRNDAGIDSPADFAGKKLASPQVGNTQDVALRNYLKEHGYEVKREGGNPEIRQVKPADMLTLMAKKELDGAWVAEPWGARLVREAGARVFVNEQDLWQDGKFATSLLVCKADYIKSNPETVKRLIEAHVSETQWINSHKEEAIKSFNTAVSKILGSGFNEDDLRTSLTRMEFTYDPLEETVQKAADDAYALGLLDKKPGLSGMFDLQILNGVLQERGLATIG